MAIFGAISVVREQTQGWTWSAHAFAYLDEVMTAGSAAHQRILALAAGSSGRIELADGIYAIEQAYATRTRAESVFESHRRYHDIQVIVAGEETMAVIDIGQLSVTQPYVAEKDVILYADCAAASVLRFRAGEATVYFPADGHMPCLRVGAEAGLVHKTVIKVPVDGWAR